MKRWQYHSIFVFNLSDIHEILNVYGHEGWELVSALPTDATHSSTTLILKREGKK